MNLLFHDNALTICFNSYYERLTHILLENVYFPSAFDFLFALQYTSRQENEKKAMLMWGLDSLDETFEKDWSEEESEDELNEGLVKAEPLHIQIKSAMQVCDTFPLDSFYD